MPSFEIVELDSAGKTRPFPVGVFPDGKTAASIIADLQGKFPNKKFQPRPIKDTTGDWRAREQRRFDEGLYEPLGLPLTPIPDHFAHKALKVKANVAYTPEQQAGALDKQVSIHIKTYLARFYPNLTIEERRKMVWDFCGEKFGDEMQIALTPEDIVRVYTNGPSSCMAGSINDDWRNLGHHPAEAYAGPDLGVAYIEDNNGNITARTLVWPEKKIYSRIYGDSDKMYLALQENGYEDADAADFIGARMTLIEVSVPFYDEDTDEYTNEGDTGYLCPYIDRAGGVKIEGNYLVICDDHANGRMYCKETEGWTS